FHVGEAVTLCGPIRWFRFFPEMHHPEILSEEEAGEPVHSGRIVPVYPEVEGVPPRVLRRIQWEVVRRHASLEIECFPPRILERAGIPPLQESLASIHFPHNDADAARFREFSSPEQRRLIFGELFSLQWALALRRAGMEREEATPLPWDREIVDEIKRRLPFDLTGAQRRVVNEILKDLGKPHPMHRLLQGDVGSGKTIVAWIAAMVAWRHGVQSAVMAPTEILAEQHYRRFIALSTGLPVRVVLLSAALPPKGREAVRERIRDGEADIIVGTHALIQESVEFRDLALGVIDEQHRFGVLQRASLRRKARISPHLLVMTATPIPRTLAITLYGDLDVSVIDEMPRGRIPVRTKVVTEDGRRTVFEEIRKEIAGGGRAYVVLPLVEESERVALRDATRTAERLREAFPGIGVGLLHGRMKAAEKEATMGRFKSGELQLLVSTTVVEVGVDVPEATVMVVEHAERFGLSQLHQLRGRVGRGTRPSSCFLMAGGEQGEDAVARLSVMERTVDGFRIAEEDLRIRGPGDFAGVRQSGIPDLVFADLVRDASILRLAREIAEELHRDDPALSAPEHVGIRRFLELRPAAAAGRD
ncbi:MAG TPA: ATP-dependent DNA helicase RecG, partial [Candidatus Deferrimicrobiaceae bacterium]|nr:ATP-dependent DNA helicase RecG [Candidatus Deferrimicrobiaceae bacterium]